MRTIIAAALGAALVYGGACWAAPPPHAPSTGAEVSAQDYLKAIHDACPGKTAPTADGEPTVGCTRGFSLATEGPSAAAPGAKGKTTAKAPRRGGIQRVSAAAMPHSSRLSDLLIHFKLGSAELTPMGQANAANFAEALRDPSVAKLRFEIAGHTDVSGAAARNRTLSQQRAEAVRDYLVGQGVDAARLTAKGYGSSQLADAQAPRAAANRRVEARPL